MRFKSFVRSVAFDVTLVAVMAVAVLLANSSPAQGYTFTDCQFDSHQPPSITWYFHDFTQTYYSAFSWAANEWNDHTSPTTYLQSQVGGDPNIDVYDASYADSWWGFTDWSCWSTGTYVGDEVRIRLNTRTMASLTNTNRMFVASHEIGHAYGLDHSSFTCSSPGPVVMKTGSSKFSCAGLPPWSNDVAGWNVLY